MKVIANAGIDADMIAPCIWQGSAPAFGRVVADAGYDVLVLCASEHQPSVERYPGVQVLLLPFDDDPRAVLTEYELRRIRQTARVVAKHAAEGRIVLVTCLAGLNRSGLVCAMALHYLTGKPGAECLAAVQAKRARALFNVKFQAILKRIRSRRTA